MVENARAENVQLTGARGGGRKNTHEGQGGCRAQGRKTESTRKIWRRRREQETEAKRTGDDARDSQSGDERAHGTTSLHKQACPDGGKTPAKEAATE